MRVKLISASPDPFWLIVKAGRECYASVSTTTSSDKRLFLNLLRNEESPLEHAVFSFQISEVSRVLSHQLVRHRLASYSQQSQRYVEADCRYVIPQMTYLDSATHAFVKDAYHRFMLRGNDLYLDFINRGVKREDARYILSSATHTSLIMTMNLRELCRFWTLRLSPKAQQEVRNLAQLTLSLVISCFPHELCDDMLTTIRKE